MAKLRVVGGTGLMLAGFALLLTRCAEAPSRDRGDDDDAGAPNAGSMNQAGVGGSAGQNAGGTAPSAGTSGAGGSGTAGANTGGSVGGGGGSTAGTLNTAGSLPTAGGGACDDAPQVLSRFALPEPVEQAAFEAAFPALVCAAAAACCARGTIPYDAAACLSYAASTALDRTLGFDRYEAGRCLESLAQYDLTCPADLGDAGLPNGCYLAYRGPLALGEACDRMDDCLPDPRGRVGCELVESLGHTACVVNIRGKLGDRCDAGCEISKDLGICHLQGEDPDPLAEVICEGEDGLYCHGFDGVCRATKGNGCECLVSEGDCNPNHTCRDEGVYSYCRPRFEAGASCPIFNDCELGSFCTEETEVCTLRGHQGEPCEEHDECLGWCESAGCGLDNGDPRGLFRDAFCDGVGSDD